MVTPVLTPDEPVTSGEVSRSDAELLKRFRDRGDQAAFDELLQRYSGLVYQICHRISVQNADAEDAFQMTFLILATRARSIRKANSVSSWLFGVAHRSALEVRRRSQKRSQELSADPPDQAPEVFDKIARQDQVEKLDEAIATLPDRYRAVIVLHHYEGQKVAEIAQRTNQSERAVEGLLRRGRDRLKRSLLSSGISLPAAVGGLLLFQKDAAAATVTPSLIEATRNLCLDPTAAAEAAQLIPVQSLIQESSSMLAKPFLIPTGIAAGLTLTVAFLTGPGQAVGQFGGGMGFGTPQNPHRSRALFMNTATEGEYDSGAAAEAEIGFGGGEGYSAGGFEGSFGGDFVNEEKKTSKKLTGSELSNAEMAPKALGTNIREQLEASLVKRVQLEFIETPFVDVIDFLSEVSQTPIDIDEISLDEIGVSVDLPITESTGDLSLASALDEILLPQEMDYVIRNERLVIVSQDDAEEFLEPKFYRVPETETQDYIPLLESMIETDSWESTGGNGVVIATPQLLIVKQTQRNHRKIKKFLDELATNVNGIPAVSTQFYEGERIDSFQPARSSTNNSEGDSFLGDTPVSKF